MTKLLTTTALAATLFAGAVQAQQIPSYHHMEQPRTDMAPRTYVQPMINATREAALSEMRVRVVAKMVSRGRCDDALKLARRQNDKVLAERITATCTVLRSGKWPT